MLGELLNNSRHKVSYLAQQDSKVSAGNYSPTQFGKTEVLQSAEEAKRLDAICRRLASRPLFFPLLEWILERTYMSAIRKALDGVQPYAIHFTGTGWDFFGFPMARLAKNSGIPFTIWPAVHPNSWGDDVIDLRLYNLADRVFCASKFESKHLIEKGLKQNKTVLCGLPPMLREDGNGLRLRGLLDISERPAILFLGRRDEGKGYPALLNAWRRVVEVVPDAVLLIAGPGGKEFESLKSELPEASYRDLGIPDEQQKADAYAACDVFCLPSDHESFGIVYVEAWSYGKPVICGTAPASRELIQDGLTGLWGSQNIEFLAKKIIKLLSNPETATEMGCRGLQRQQQYYSQETMIRQHMNAWETNFQEE